MTLGSTSTLFETCTVSLTMNVLYYDSYVKVVWRSHRRARWFVEICIPNGEHGSVMPNAIDHRGHFNLDSIACCCLLHEILNHSPICPDR